MPIKKKHLAQGSATVNPSEFISDGDQHKIYSNFYLAAKQNLKAKNYQAVQAHFTQADTLHLSNRCQLTFAQWIITQFIIGYGTEDNSLNMVYGCMNELHQMGLNFLITTRENQSMLLDTIERNQLPATMFYHNVLQQKIPPLLENTIDSHHPLLIAYDHYIKSRDLKMFTYLSCAIPALTEDHNTAMTLAARHGDMTMLNLLIGYNEFPINEADSRRMTPLMYALVNGHHAYALRLIEAGADLLQRNDDGDTALHFLFQNPHAEDSAQLLVKEPFLALMHEKNVAPLLDNTGHHPLHQAIRAEQTPSIKLFLSKNPDLINLTLPNGDSLLDYAVDMQCLKSAKFLHSKNPHATDPRQHAIAPLFRALKQPNTALLDWLLTLEDTDNAVFLAKYPDQVDNLACLLVRHGHLASLISLKLLSKNPQQLLHHYAHGNTCLELFYESVRTKGTWDERDRKFFHQVIAALDLYAASQPDFSALNYFSSLLSVIELALRDDATLIKKQLFHAEPLLNSIEHAVYHRHLRDGFFDVSAYKTTMRGFIKALREGGQTKALNDKQPHLFIHIITQGLHVTERIASLYAIGGFRLTDLDAEKLSLLELACKLANRELLDWCFSHAAKSAFTINPPRTCFLDWALKSNQADFCEYLFSEKISSEQWLSYFKTIEPMDKRMTILQQHAFFNLRLNNKSKEFKDMARWPNSLFKQHFSVKPIPVATPRVNDIVEKPSALTLDELESLIKNNHVKKVKTLKSPLYDDTLRDVLNNNIERLLTLCMCEHNYKKIQKHQQRGFAGDNEMHVNMMNEFMGITLINEWVVEHFHQAISIAIHSHSVGALSLCLRALPEDERQPILFQNGFDYALWALDSRNPFMLGEVLKQKAIFEQVLLHQNELLLAAIDRSCAAHALLLLRKPELNGFAHINHNEALHHASMKNELSCVSLELVTLPAVVEQLQSDDGSILENAIRNDDDDLKDALVLHRNEALPLTDLASESSSGPLEFVNPPAMLEQSQSDNHTHPMHELSPQHNIMVNHADPIHMMPPLPFIPIISIKHQDYELAVLCDNYDYLGYLLHSYQDSCLIKHLIMQALHCSKPAMVQFLFNNCHNPVEIEMDGLFCHQMMHDAILSHCFLVMAIGFDINTRSPFVHFYNNQLLNMCVNMDLTDVARQLLQSKPVQHKAHYFKNKTLRLACARGHLDLVNDLLHINSVRNKVFDYDYGAYRKAIRAHHQPVVLRLLDVLDVFEFACQKKATYPHFEWVLAYAKNKLTHWAAKPNTTISDTQQQYQSRFVSTLNTYGMSDAIKNENARITSLLSNQGFFAANAIGSTSIMAADALSTRALK